MATTKYAPGNPLNFIATADVASSDLIVAGSIVGVAQTNALTGESVALDTEGCHELPKADPTHTFAVGAKAYATSASTITSTASGNKLCGYATVANENGDATVKVRLIPAA